MGDREWDEDRGRTCSFAAGARRGDDAHLCEHSYPNSVMALCDLTRCTCR